MFTHSQIFRLLGSFELSEFDESCWQSTIRHRVASHDEYRNVSRWSGRETADIVYQDQSSNLTSILIAKGYLNSLVWDGASPKYYIEVKTTTGPLEHHFSAVKDKLTEWRGWK